MKRTLDRTSVLALLLGLIASYAVASYMTDPLSLRSLVAGYVLFALNYLALKSISRTLVLIAMQGTTSSRAKLWLTVGSMAKFIGLIGALFLLLVTFKLSGFFLAFGSLLSLVVLTGVQVVSYLRGLAAGTTARPKV